MNSELSLKLIRAILPEEPWTEDRLREAMRELRVLADYKYNKYEMYQPGRLFFESLFLFLSRLDQGDRTTALEFIRRHLMYISRDEFQQLAHILHYDQIRQRHLDMVAHIASIPRHRIADLRSSPELGRLQRASLYVALSDGARIDYFRRHNLDINNEQVLSSYDVGPTKLADLSARLADAIGEKEAKFDCLFLLDDFCGSGRTLVREVVVAQIAEDVGPLTVPQLLRAQLAYDAKSRELTWQYRGAFTQKQRSSIESMSDAGAYRTAVAVLQDKAASGATETKGSLAKIAKSDLVKLVSERARVFFSPLLATQYALERLAPLLKRLQPPLNRVELLPAAVIPDSVRVTPGSGPVSDICVRYYDTSLEDEHTGDVTYGYDACGLPLVLHHNTPNNSVYWLWARKWNDPLFVRYERHGREVAS